MDSSIDAYDGVRIIVKMSRLTWGNYRATSIMKCSKATSEHHGQKKDSTYQFFVCKIKKPEDSGWHEIDPKW